MAAHLDKKNSKARFRCTVTGCEKIYTRNEHLRRHLRSHKSQRPFLCSICKHRFGRQDVLKRHIQQHESPSLPIVRCATACDRCHSRKSKCSGSQPCEECIRSKTCCVRKRQIRKGSLSMVNNNSYVPSRSVSPSASNDHIPGTGSYSSPRNATVTSEFQLIDVPMTQLSDPGDILSDIEAHNDTSRFSEEPIQQQGVDDFTTDVAEPVSGFPTSFVETPSSHHVTSLRSVLDNDHRRGSLRQDLDVGSGVSKDPFSEFALLGVSPAPSPSSSNLSPRSRMTDSNVSQTSVTDYENCNLSDYPGPKLVSSLMVPYFGSELTLLQKCFDTYFCRFHPLWPVLHRVTFNVDEEPPELINTVVLIGAWMSDDNDLMENAILLHRKLKGFLQDECFSRIATVGKESNWPISTYQAMLLNTIFDMQQTDRETAPHAYLLNCMLIALFRDIGLFQEQKILAQDNPKVVGTRRWIMREKLKRLAFQTFRLDCYLSLIQGVPPTLRVEEMCLPLPCSHALWEAPSLQAWYPGKIAEPKTRISKCFESIVQDAASLDLEVRAKVPILMKDDYLLGMCAMQGWLWRDIRRRRPHKRNDSTTDIGFIGTTPVKPPSTKSNVAFWKFQLEIWRSGVETENLLLGSAVLPSIDFPSDATHFTCMMLYHLSYLHLHADFESIHTLTQRGSSISNGGARRFQLESDIFQWAKSADARTAMVHAAQILKEWRQRMHSLDPVSVSVEFAAAPVPYIALYKAALVVWAVARASHVCDLCAVGTHTLQDEPNLEIIELMDANAHNDIIDNLISVDTGIQESLDGTLICICKLEPLVRKFETELLDGSRCCLARRLGELLSGLKEDL